MSFRLFVLFCGIIGIYLLLFSLHKSNRVPIFFTLVLLVSFTLWYTLPILLSNCDYWYFFESMVGIEIEEYNLFAIGEVYFYLLILFYTKNNYMYYVVRAFSREEAAVNMVAMQEKIQEYSSTIVMDYTRVLILVNTDDLSTLSLPRVSYTYMCVKVNRSEDGKIKVMSVKE